MRYVVKSVELRGGLRVPYVEQGDASGVPVTLLHGFAGSWRSFELVLPHLPERVHAFAPTQRGHGDASKPAEGYRVRDFAADVTGFMDAVGIEAAVLVSASSGGIVARRFAIEHPERTRALVLLGTPATLRGKPPVEALWESTISEMTDPVDPAFVRAFIEGVVPSSVPGDFVEEAVEQALKLPARAWREINRGLLADDSIDELHKIAAPTLIIWGDQDAIALRSDQGAMRKAMAESRLLVYGGAGHTVHFEEPERVAADVAAFVEEMTADGSVV